MSLISISMLLSHKDVTKGLRQLQKWVLYSQGESNIPQDMNTPSSNWREQSSEETSSNPIKRKQELEILYVESFIEYIGFIVPQLFISNNNLLYMVFYNILTCKYESSMFHFNGQRAHINIVCPTHPQLPLSTYLISPSLLLFAWIPKQTELGSKWSRCFYQSQ